MGKAQELIVKREGAIATLVINRPDKGNFLTPALLEEMTRAVQVLSKNDGLRVLVIRGAGDRAFSTGYDITALPSTSPPDAEEALKETPPLETAFRAVESFPFPVIAMVNGHAFGGGCELAVACDIRIAAENAAMGMPPAKLGLVYHYLGLKRFLRILGFARTLEMFLAGRNYGSAECLAMGLVNHVVDAASLEETVYELASEVAKHAPLALKGTKRILYRMTEYPEIGEEDQDLFKDLFLRSLRSRDLEEGKRAFRERRTPEFKGR